MRWEGIVIEGIFCIYILTIAIIAYNVIMENRSPVRTLAWITVLVAIPLVGLVLYMYFGINYRKVKMFSRKGLGDEKWLEYMSEKNSGNAWKSAFFSKGDFNKVSHLITLLINNNKAVLTKGNRVDILNNGEEAFPSMFTAMRKARKFIHIEYYIFEKGELWNTLKGILTEKAENGVEVRMIYDDVGSWKLPAKDIKEMRAVGIQVYPFLPVRFRKLAHRANYRNHRKLLIVDGESAFTGGMNFADRYMAGLEGIGIWRDTHVRVKGEAVKALHTVFLTDWYFVRQELLLDKEQYLPLFREDRNVIAQAISSGPDSDWATIRQAYFSMITMAKEHVYISTPYFMTGDAMLTAIKTAAMSGVDVRLLLPWRSDSVLTYWCTRSYAEELLEAGVKIYAYRKGFNHSKLIMVDGLVASVGTANMDNRSFEQNFEVGLIVYDREVTDKLEAFFKEDIKNSEQIYLNNWKFRPGRERVKESLSRLFAPLL